MLGDHLLSGFRRTTRRTDAEKELSRQPRCTASVSRIMSNHRAHPRYKTHNLGRLIIASVGDSVAEPASSITTLALDVTRVRGTTVIPRIIDVVVIPQDMMIIVKDRKRHVRTDDVGTLRGRTDTIGAGTEYAYVVPCVKHPGVLMNAAGGYISTIFPNDISASTQKHRVPGTAHTVT